jgi:RimJ/RimL family protein N-acetyltransferase
MSGPTFRKSHNIKTQRLVIRSAVPGDAQGIAALRGNPINNPFEGTDSGDPEEYLRRMVNWRKAHDDGRYAFTVILRRPDPSSSSAGDEIEGGEGEEGELIGFGGFNEFRWIDSPDGQQGHKVLEVDIGAQIDHKHWRQGYGREAFIGMADYAFTELGAEQVSCDTNTENEPWRGLMKSVGLGKKERAHVNGEGHPGAGEEAWLWQFTREDWANAKAGGSR